MSAEVVDTATPVPLSEIRADDILLDALGGRDTTPAAEVTTDALCVLLRAWRREVDRPPMPVLVDTPRAVVLLEQARPVSRPSLRARAARFFSRLTRRTR